jgi:hypothetical protein
MRYLTVLTRFLCGLVLLSGMVVALPEQVQAAPPDCQWSSGGCTTYVWQWDLYWHMVIDCADGSHWVGSGWGEWGGNCPNG